MAPSSRLIADAAGPAHVRPRWPGQPGLMTLVKRWACDGGHRRRGRAGHRHRRARRSAGRATAHPVACVPSSECRGFGEAVTASGTDHVDHPRDRSPYCCGLGAGDRPPPRRPRPQPSETRRPRCSMLRRDRTASGRRSGTASAIQLERDRRRSRSPRRPGSSARSTCSSTTPGSRASRRLHRTGSRSVDLQRAVSRPTSTGCSGRPRHSRRLLEASDAPVVVNVSSAVGSLGRNSEPGSIAGRCWRTRCPRIGSEHAGTGQQVPVKAHPRWRVNAVTPAAHGDWSSRPRPGRRWSVEEGAEIIVSVRDHRQRWSYRHLPGSRRRPRRPGDAGREVLLHLSTVVPSGSCAVQCSGPSGPMQSGGAGSASSREHRR